MTGEPRDRAVTGDAAAPPPISTARLLTTLGGAGAVAGLLIVLAYQLTLPAVEATRLARIERAIFQVLPGIDRYETLYLNGDALDSTPPATAAGVKVERIYVGLDAKGRRVGYAIPASEPGFQDAIDVIFGFDPDKPQTLGLAILASRETPGLGDRIESPQWLAQFTDAQTPLVAVKARASRTPQDVDMVTGATISSRTVIAAINKAVARWSPIIEKHNAGGGS